MDKTKKNEENFEIHKQYSVAQLLKFWNYYGNNDTERSSENKVEIEKKNKVVHEFNKIKRLVTTGTKISSIEDFLKLEKVATKKIEDYNSDPNIDPTPNVSQNIIENTLDYSTKRNVLEITDIVTNKDLLKQSQLVDKGKIETFVNDQKEDIFGPYSSIKRKIEKDEDEDEEPQTGSTKTDYKTILSAFVEFENKLIKYH